MGGLSTALGSATQIGVRRRRGHRRAGRFSTLRSVSTLFDFGRVVSAPESGLWLIDQLVEETYFVADPLTDVEREVLCTPRWDFPAEDGEALVALNNRLVPLARRRMDRQKAMGVRTLPIRDDLRVPAEWQAHHLNIQTWDLPWVIAFVMQNALFVNTPGGETTAWRSA